MPEEIGSSEPSDKKPITQFFSFLDTTTSLLKAAVTRYIKVSDNAWRALLGIFFIIVLWLSGDLQKFIFIAITGILSILIIIDIIIDNWGKIFRTFRNEKTFKEMIVDTPTSIIQILSKYNVVGNDMLELLDHLKKKNWTSMRMVDTLLTQQHLDDFAVNKLLTANLSKKDLLRLINHYHNSAGEGTIKEVLTKWDYSEDLIKDCLKYQIASIEQIRKAKNVSRNNFKPIENLCPIKNIEKHWLLKPFRIIFIFAGLITAYLLFTTQQGETLRAVAPSGGTQTEAILALTATNIGIAVITSSFLWFLLYFLTLPVMKFIYRSILNWKFESTFKEVFSKKTS